MKVGFIGLGIMGKPMSKNLIKAGHELVVCDFNKDAVKELTDLGAVSASCGAEVAQQCDVIITMLPNSPHVRTVALGEGGIIEGAKEGTVLIDMSSIDPTESKAISAELETALSIITTSYLRNEDIQTAVEENLEYLNPPVKNAFAVSAYFA